MIYQKLKYIVATTDISALGRVFVTAKSCGFQARDSYSAVPAVMSMVGLGEMRF